MKPNHKSGLLWMALAVLVALSVVPQTSAQVTLNNPPTPANTPGNTATPAPTCAAGVGLGGTGAQGGIQCQTPVPATPQPASTPQTIGNTPTYGWAGPAPYGAVGTGAWPSANRAYFVPIDISWNGNVTKIKIEIIVASGNGDVGLYGPTGTKLASSGSTALAGTSAVQTFSIASTPVTPGQYFIGMAVDNGTAVVLNDTFTIQSTIRATQVNTSFPLPASFTPAGGASFMPILVVTTA